MIKRPTKKPSTSRPATRVAKTPASPTRPGGKLGLIVQRLEGKVGATVDELAEATGWQRHAVRGALSRLRTRGFEMRLDGDQDRKAYRLARIAR